MAFDFPSNPTNGQVFTAGGVTYAWAGYAWTITGTAGGGVSIADAPPASPVPGQLFWESDTAALYVYYNDGNSQQWVQVNGTVGAGSGGAGVTIGDTLPASPVPGQLFWESDTGIFAIYYDDGTSQQWVQLNGTVAAPPINRVAPAITGTQLEGQTLTVSNGTWTGSPTNYTHQWLRAVTSGDNIVISGGLFIGTAIPGATASTYVLQAADAGQKLYCEVTASNTAGPTVKQSNATGVVAGSPPVNTVLPAITGTALAGQTLTVSNGTWTGNSSGYTYQWFRAGVSISGATAATYVLQVGDIDATFYAEVTTTNSVGPATVPSNTTAVVTSPNLLTDSNNFVGWAVRAGTTVTPNNATGPTGSTDASTIAMAVDAYDYALGPVPTSGGKYIYSVHVKGTVGQKVAVRADVGGATAFTLVTFTGIWQRVGVPVITASGTAAVQSGFEVRAFVGETLPAVTFQAYGTQLERVNSATTPSSYKPT